jgi:hypothetical protein
MSGSNHRSLSAAWRWATSLSKRIRTGTSKLLQMDAQAGQWLMHAGCSSPPLNSPGAAWTPPNSMWVNRRGYLRSLVVRNALLQLKRAQESRISFAGTTLGASWAVVGAVGSELYEFTLSCSTDC